MSRLDEEFSWPKARALELLPPSTLSSDAQGTIAGSGEQRMDHGSIVQRGNGCDLLRPLSVQNLCLQFASLELTSTSCLSFAQKWGFLTKPASGSTFEPVSLWLDEIKRMRDALDNSGPLKLENGVILPAHIELRPGPEGVVIRTRPATLLGGLWLQLAERIAGGATLITCDHCGQWFAAGSPGGRRRVARFCSPKCKHGWHNARRAAAG